MYRLTTNRFIHFYANTLQSFVLKGRPVCLAVNAYHNSQYTTPSQSLSADILRNADRTVTKSLADLRDKRLQQMKRSIPSGDQDVLSEAIIKSATVDQLLELVSMHVNVMNNRHLSDVFESLHDIIRMSDNYNDHCLKILSSKEFSQLCNQSIKRMRFFQTSDLLTTLKCLVLLRLSPNTAIVKSLLQMIRQLINDFSLNEIIFLDFLLNRRLIQSDDAVNESEVVDNFDSVAIDDHKSHRKQTIVPLMEALKLAIPLVLQLKIESKELDFDDIDLVVKCLRTVAKHNLKDEVVNRLTTAISHNIPELSISQMFSVIASLIWVSSPNSNMRSGLVDRVVNQCLDRVTAPGIVIPNNTSYNFIVSLITHKTRRDFYHNGLYEMVANLIIQNPTKMHISKATGVLWALTKHSHVHYGLLDFMSDKIAARDPELIVTAKTSFTNILSAFSLPSNYKPNDPNSELVYKTILESNHVKLCKEKTQFLLFKMLRHFFVLKYYPKQEIFEWFDKYFNEALTSSTVIGVRIEFLDTIRVLYQGLCLESDITDCEDFKLKLKPFVEELVEFETKEFEDSCKSETLEFALSQGLGGKQYFASNLFTDFGHLVDHVIVMRKGGYPVPIINKDEKLTYISQLDIPSDAKILGIIPLTYKDFCREPNIKKGETDFRLRTLKSCGIIPITIHVDGWEALSEMEKIPYIMREIQENSSVDEKQSNIH